MARSLNKVMLIGNVADEPTIRNIGDNGGVMANITLVTNDYRASENGEYAEIPSWHRVVFWGSSAEIVSKYVHKGTRLYVEGKLRYGSYVDKNGVKRYTTDISCDQLILLDKRQDDGASSAGAGAGDYASPEYAGSAQPFASVNQGHGVNTFAPGMNNNFTPNNNFATGNSGSFAPMAGNTGSFGGAGTNTFAPSAPRVATNGSVPGSNMFGGSPFQPKAPAVNSNQPPFATSHFQSPNNNHSAPAQFTDPRNANGFNNMGSNNTNFGAGNSNRSNFNQAQNQSAATPSPAFNSTAEKATKSSGFGASTQSSTSKETTNSNLLFLNKKQAPEQGAKFEQSSQATQNSASATPAQATKQAPSFNKGAANIQDDDIPF